MSKFGSRRCFRGVNLSMIWEKIVIDTMLIKKNIYIYMVVSLFSSINNNVRHKLLPKYAKNYMPETFPAAKFTQKRTEL